MQISINLTLASHCMHGAHMDSCCGAGLYQRSITVHTLLELKLGTKVFSHALSRMVRVRVIDRQTNGYDQVRPKMRKGRGREGPGTEASGPDWRKWQRKTGNAKSEAAEAGSAVRSWQGRSKASRVLSRSWLG
jgi:hypothetical protein